MRIRADAAVLPTAPVRVTVNAAKPAGLRGVRYTLDGRGQRSGRHAPYNLALAPSALTPGRHMLVARLRPRIAQPEIDGGRCEVLAEVGAHRLVAGKGCQYGFEVGGLEFGNHLSVHPWDWPARAMSEPVYAMAGHGRTEDSATCPAEPMLPMANWHVQQAIDSIGFTSTCGGTRRPWTASSVESNLSRGGFMR